MAEDEGSGRMDTGPGRARRTMAAEGALLNIPPIVAVVSLVLAAVYFASKIAPELVLALTGGRFGLSPALLFAGPEANGGVIPMIAPLFSHMLIHATLAHLLFNLLWFMIFGSPLARRFQSAGRFLSFFALGGAAGGVFFSIFHANDPTVLIGASGGVTGLLGGLVRFAFISDPLLPPEYRPVAPLLHPSVLAWSAVVIVINASVAFFGPGFGVGDADVAWQAHVGGFLFGLVAFPLFDRQPR
jgi:membrane associated rhomboid family serine protease